MNPPHRIKSISMSTFTADEVELMRWKGNLWCSRAWLANYDRASHPVDYKDDEKIKEFMIAKVSGFLNGLIESIKVKTLLYLSQKTWKNLLNQV